MPVTIRRLIQTTGINAEHIIGRYLQLRPLFPKQIIITEDDYQLLDVVLTDQAARAILGSITADPAPAELAAASPYLALAQQCGGGTIISVYDLSVVETNETLDKIKISLGPCSIVRWHDVMLDEFSPAIAAARLTEHGWAVNPATGQHGWTPYHSESFRIVTSYTAPVLPCDALVDAEHTTGAAL